MKGLDSESIEHIEDDEFRKAVQVDRECWCLDQAIDLMKAAVTGNEPGYFAILEMKPDVENAWLLGKGGVPLGQYSRDHKEEMEEIEWTLVSTQTQIALYKNEKLKKLRVSL